MRPLSRTHKIPLYVCSNGAAHLKNFSLFESAFGDYILTPAYDVLCTSLHFPEEAQTVLGRLHAPAGA